MNTHWLQFRLRTLSKASRLTCAMTHWVNKHTLKLLGRLHDYETGGTGGLRAYESYTKALGAPLEKKP